MMTLEEGLKREYLKEHLSDKELLLPDYQREALVLKRQLLESGFLREPDLVMHDFSEEGKIQAALRNGFGLSTFLAVTWRRLRF